MAAGSTFTSSGLVLSWLILMTSLVVYAGASDAFMQASARSHDILLQLEQSMGEHFRRDVEDALPGAEADLRPLFKVLAESLENSLGPSKLRYALHRKLLQRRGWRVKGIDPEGHGWSQGLPAEALKDVAPPKIVSLFEQHLGDDGMDLRESALMLATLERFVEEDAHLRVAKAYEAKGLIEQTVNGDSTESQLHWALETYLRSAILGPRDARLMSPRIVEKLWSYNMTEQYPGWPRTMSWISQIEHEREGNRTKQALTNKATFSPSEVGRIVNDVSDKYGVWQNSECRSLKTLLLSLEDGDCPGHVTLARFYDSALHGGRWQLTESLPYLKASGALDETDEQFPSVIIPNYLTSLTNCVAGSSFFATCCLDECEGVMSDLEAALQSPTASPDDIVGVVAGLSTMSQPARRQLSGDLLLHLQDIAKVHGGMVPIHGRLFAQWLHHAFPRDCTYPHESSTTNPKTHLDWQRETGSGPEATRSEMMFFSETHKLGKTLKARQLAHSDLLDGDLGADASLRQCSTWSSREEMLTAQPRLLYERFTDTGTMPAFGFVALVATAFSLLGMSKARRTYSGNGLFRL